MRGFDGRRSGSWRSMVENAVFFKIGAAFGKFIPESN